MHTVNTDSAATVVIIDTDKLASPRIGSNVYENRANSINQHAEGERPEVTIVVQAYNRIDKTKQCVEALQRYTNDIDYQLILVDNGSSDHTLDFFKSVEHPRKTIIKITRNIGAYYTGKYIRQYTEGKYLCILANDIIVTNKWLYNMLICMKSDKRIGWVIPSSSNTSNLQDPLLSFNNLQEMQMKAAAFNISDPCKWHERLRNVAATALVRIELYDVVGLGDYGFFHDFGDDDLAFRTRRAGYKLMLCKDTFIHHNHEVFKGEGKDPVQFQNSLEKGKKDFQEKYYGLDAWDDVNNFESAMVNLVKPPNAHSGVEVLGIDVKCGTPILETKNKLRGFHIFDTRLSSFFSEPKYWLDLKTICEGDVICDRIEFIHEYFASNRFDCIVVGLPINVYKNNHRLLSELLRMIKPDGQILMKLKNTHDARTFLNILGNKGYFDATFPLHLSVNELQKKVEHMGGSVTDYAAESHSVDEQTKSQILNTVKKVVSSVDVDDIFGHMLIDQYVLRISKQGKGSST